MVYAWCIRYGAALPLTRGYFQKEKQNGPESSAPSARTWQNHATFNAPKKSMQTDSANSRKGARRLGDAIPESTAGRNFTHMTKPAITGIAPFFIVRNVPSALSFYRDRPSSFIRPDSYRPGTSCL